MIDKKSVKLLKYLYENGNTPFSDLKQLYGDNFENDIHYLEEVVKYVKRPSAGSTVIDRKIINVKSKSIDITPGGRAYLESIPRNRLHFWIPVSISILSLIISILAFIKP
jgi:hypothetical protein